jgi:hypothetical protein
MPYQIKEVKGGYKVKKKQKGKPKYFSKKPISKLTALKQMRALYLSDK